jgi:hypothetical protein
VQKEAKEVIKAKGKDNMVEELSESNKCLMQGVLRLQKRRYFGSFKCTYRDGDLIKVDEFVETLKPKELPEGM